MLSFGKELLAKLILIVYLGHRDKGKSAQVAVHQHWLCVCVADYTYSRVTLELVQFVLKTSPEIGIFQIVNTAEKLTFFT